VSSVFVFSGLPHMPTMKPALTRCGVALVRCSVLFNVQ
jgi:hypothetical protein